MSSTRRPMPPPVFIVGMPRSGTKLLRELLNNHSKIAIPRFETEFLPYWVKHWERFGDLSHWPEFETFYRGCLGLPYFHYQRNAGTLIDSRDWHRLCGAFDPAGVFVALVRHDAGAGEDMIWGDKSPSYIHHFRLIKDLFPGAKVIHIVRDVRDYCLSIHQAWGKNMLRAAQRWADDVGRARADMSAFPDSFLDVQYEKLISTPDAELRRVCAYLGLSYEEDMTRLTHPIENRGAATGQSEILRDNAGKWRHSLRPDMKKKIEQIACGTLREFGYPVDDRIEPRRLGKAAMAAFKAMDGLNLVATHRRGRGTIGAALFHLQQARVSRTRSPP